MRILSIILVFFVMVTFGFELYAQDHRKSQQEADQLWEEVIKAKGGRDRLFSVRNIVVSSQGKFRTGFRTYEIRLEDLYVFPNKYWKWVDHRPSVFGLTILMHDREHGKKYFVSGASPMFSGLENISGRDGPNTNLSGISPELLLETAWNKPTPELIYQLRFKNNNFQVIQTRLQKHRIDFVIDKKSLLPVQIIGYPENGTPIKTTLGKYYEISGIKMPAEVMYEDSDGKTKYKRSYLINVDYDESIFETPPPFEADPDAWKKKK